MMMICDDNGGGEGYHGGMEQEQCIVLEYGVEGDITNRVNASG